VSAQRRFVLLQSHLASHSRKQSVQEHFFVAADQNSLDVPFLQGQSLMTGSWLSGLNLSISKNNSKRCLQKNA